MKLGHSTQEPMNPFSLMVFFVVLASFSAMARAQIDPIHVMTNSLPTLDEALAARQDVWGLAAMAQPNGPSYEFFARLLPPLRYVNAAFRHYPIVLSAPNAKEASASSQNAA